MNNSAQQNRPSMEITANLFLEFTENSNQSYLFQFLIQFWQRLVTINSAGFYVPRKYLTGQDNNISHYYLKIFDRIGIIPDDYVLCITGLDDVFPGKNINNLQLHIYPLNMITFHHVDNSLIFLSQAIDNQLKSTQDHIGNCLECLHQEYMQTINWAVGNFSTYLLHTNNNPVNIIHYYNNLAMILLGLYHVLHILFETAENVNNVFDIDSLKHIEARCGEISTQHPLDYMKAHFCKLSFMQKKAITTIHDLMLLFTDYIARNFKANIGGKGL